MKRSRKIAFAVAASLGVAMAVAAVFAQPFGMGPGMMHGMDHGAAAGGHGPMAGATAMLTKQDAGSSADMGLVHDLVMNHNKIKRTVTNLPDGIKTVTESDDPQVAQTIKAHVASMSQRLKDGREFNIFSTTLPVLFENRDKIKSVVEVTEKGSIVTRTSTDAKVVAALQGHAAEVTELAQEGMVAMRRGMMARMAAGSRGPQAGMRPGAASESRTPAGNENSH
jgi:acetolactate synthase small subunit